MVDRRFVYPTVRELPRSSAPEDPARRVVRPQRDLVVASLLRRPAGKRR